MHFVTCIYELSHTMDSSSAIPPLSAKKPSAMMENTMELQRTTQVDSIRHLKTENEQLNTLQNEPQELRLNSTTHRQTLTRFQTCKQQYTWELQSWRKLGWLIGKWSFSWQNNKEVKKKPYLHRHAWNNARTKAMVCRMRGIVLPSSDLKMGQSHARWVVWVGRRGHCLCIQIGLHLSVSTCHINFWLNVPWTLET